MTTLVYEDVDLKKNSLDGPLVTAVAALNEFIDENRPIIDSGATLRFSLCLRPLTTDRTSSVSNMEAMKRLIALPGAPYEWLSEDKCAYFNFIEHQFVYNNVPIYLTAQEQLVLYKKLALGKKNVEKYAQIKAQLRRKFGPEFIRKYL